MEGKGEEKGKGGKNGPGGGGDWVVVMKGVTIVSDDYDTVDGDFAPCDSMCFCGTVDSGESRVR